MAQTGSGKTAAFALPILEKLLDSPQPYFACIIAPTRELAIQIAEQFEALGSFIGVKCCVLVGGVDMVPQAIALAKRPHIIVCTPGRLVDHLENTKGFSLRLLKYLVLDEADRLLDLDFGTELDNILKVLPKERNTFLFSATMTSKVSKLMRASLKDPIKVEVASKYSTVDTLLQHYLLVPAKFKDCYLAYVLNELAGATVIVFVSSRDNALRLTFLLRNLGFEAVPIHGKMTQVKRIAALNKFKSGERSILLATDVASRGLDIPSVDAVLNFDVPENSKDYIHRVGRTARAGRSGKSITFVSQYQLDLFQKIESLMNKKMDEFPMDRQDVLKLQERVMEAQRYALIQVKEVENKKGSKNDKGKKGRREKDQEFD